MLDLSFNQRRIIDLYPMFFENTYFEDVRRMGNDRVHGNVQSMCYLLKQFGIDVGNLYFS